MAWPLLAAAIPALGGIAQGLINKRATEKTNASQENIAQEANVASAQQAQKQMDFQKEQTATAHQRQAADMEKAGLNRILSATQGGASSASGAMGQTHQAQLQTPKMSGLDTAGSTAINSAKAMQEYKNLEASEKNIKAQTDLTSANEQKTKHQAFLLELEKNPAKSESELRTRQADFDKNWVKERGFNKMAGEALGTLGAAKDALNPFKGILNNSSKSAQDQKKWTRATSIDESKYGVSSKGRPYNKSTGEIYE